MGLFAEQDHVTLQCEVEPRREEEYLNSNRCRIIQIEIKTKYKTNALKGAEKKRDLIPRLFSTPRNLNEN